MRYISHLDLMRLFQRAARRAEFKLYFSQGFNPRPILRIKNALKLGLTGQDQEAELVLSEHVEAEGFRERLIAQMPDGIEIEKVKVL